METIKVRKFKKCLLLALAVVVATSATLPAASVFDDARLWWKFDFFQLDISDYFPGTILLVR